MRWQRKRQALLPPSARSALPAQRATAVERRLKENDNEAYVDQRDSA
jgi:hypothetical protein